MVVGIVHFISGVGDKQKIVSKKKVKKWGLTPFIEDKKK